MRWRRRRVHLCALLVILLFLLFGLRFYSIDIGKFGINPADSRSPLLSLSTSVLSSVATNLTQMLDRHCNRPESIGQLAKSSMEGQFAGMEDYELALVQVVTRHGDRSPIYDNSLSNWHDYRCPRKTEYNSVNHLDFLKPCGQAMLTLTGCRQHQVIGKHFRDVYKLYNEDIASKIMLVSTVYQRTTRSALCLVSGLLGHTRFDRITTSSSVMFQDSPLRHTRYPKKCNKKDKLWRLVYDQDTFRLARKRWESVRSEVNDIVVGLGWPPVQDIVHLFDGVVCHYCHLYAEGVRDSMTPCIGRNCLPLSVAVEIIRTADLSTKLNYDRKISVVLAQPLLASIVNEMEGWINGSMKSRFILYSGHDSTITALLSALEAFDGHRPPYASRLVFELWQRKGQNSAHIVRVLYNGHVVQSSFIDQLMPFDGFKQGLLFGHLRDPASYLSACLSGSW
ncbi:2-phosphoxylose phosphatase 1-like isoform X3 [Corticium candelabrum]|uniref:2-phosphoxylose phosphatase 1-like isoform X3 n=1 Tax=Corticium candelabrum TaxID=121492 RepID=UPI002E26DEE2|nr:2-phosphoxylose phosphatase 1-like isoform X3 [Corticium candelabrum]